jgi:hypothetical protein
VVGIAVSGLLIVLLIFVMSEGADLKSQKQQNRKELAKRGMIKYDPYNEKWIWINGDPHK